MGPTALGIEKDDLYEVWNTTQGELLSLLGTATALCDGPDDILLHLNCDFNDNATPDAPASPRCEVDPYTVIDYDGLGVMGGVCQMKCYDPDTDEIVILLPQAPALCAAM